MSLIDEALKRAQEAGQAVRGDSGERPWVPAPLPDAGLAQRRRFLRWLGIAMALGIVAGAGFFVIRRWPAGARTLPAAGRRGEGSPAAAAVAPTAAPTAPVKLTSVPVRLRPTRPPSPSAEGRGERDEPATAQAPAAPRPAPALADGKTYVREVLLPDGGKIELGGIVYSETQPVALLNDRVLGPGGFVEGFEVKRIETDRVELERDGVAIVLVVK